MSDVSSNAVATPPTTRRRRWIWVLLVVSLALNALLAGVILRSLWAVRANLAITGGGIEASLPAFVSTLPPDRRDALRPANAQDRPGMLRPLRMEVRRARMEAARAFLAEPFDKPAFIAAQKRLFDAETNLRLTIQHQLPEIGERMTVAERRAYLQWRGHFGPGGFRRGGGGGGGQRGPWQDERGSEPTQGGGGRRP